MYQSCAQTEMVSKTFSKVLTEIIIDFPRKHLEFSFFRQRVRFMPDSTLVFVTWAVRCSHFILVSFFRQRVCFMPDLTLVFVSWAVRWSSQFILVSFKHKICELRVLNFRDECSAIKYLLGSWVFKFILFRACSGCTRCGKLDSISSVLGFLYISV